MKSHTLITFDNTTFMRHAVPATRHDQNQPGKIHRSIKGYYAFLPNDSPESEVDKVTQIMINCSIHDTIAQLKVLSDRLEALKALRTKGRPNEA